MSSIFGGNKTSPAPAPVVPTEDDAATAATADQDRLRAASAQGYQSTILGGADDDDEGTVQKKTLLGS